MRVGGSMRARWRLLAAGVVVLVILTAVGAFFLYSAVQAQAAPGQPIPFPHRPMVRAGVTCIYCHSGALKSPAAGMPSVEKCMGCHSTIRTDSPAIQALTGYWERQQPIEWVRVYELPRHVYFSHQVHISAGFNCERCHGDVGNMTVTTRVVNMDMGWCLSCHNAQPHAAQLRDCVVCHK